MSSLFGDLDRLLKFDVDIIESDQDINRDNKHKEIIKSIELAIKEVNEIIKNKSLMVMRIYDNEERLIHVPLSILDRWSIHKHFVSYLPKQSSNTIKQYGNAFDIKLMCPEMELIYLSYYYEIMQDNQVQATKLFKNCTRKTHSRNRGCPTCSAQCYT
jgi:hypothetical protein